MKFLIGVLILPAVFLINSCSPHREYIGLPIEDARALARERNLPNRIVRGDSDYGEGRIIKTDFGEARFLTLDFRHDRLNFWVKKGKVVQVWSDDEL